MEKNACRECRKFGEKLFAKGDRCLSPKCSLTRRVNGPGVPGVKGNQKVRRRKKSEYGLQLEEKQQAKQEYGLRERQFHLIFEKAARAAGETGETMLQKLETRLDNVVYRLGWAKSRSQARQMVNHGHININGKLLDIPSYEVKVKDIIEPANIEFIKKLAESKPTIPAWLKLDKNFKAEMVALPQREEIESPIDEQLIVEFYSR